MSENFPKAKNKKKKQFPLRPLWVILFVRKNQDMKMIIIIL